MSAPIHPTTIEVLQRWRDLEESWGICREWTAFQALGRAGVAWVKAGGPDRDHPVPELRGRLVKLWERATADAITMRLVAKHGEGDA